MPRAWFDELRFVGSSRARTCRCLFPHPMRACHAEESDFFKTVIPTKMLEFMSVAAWILGVDGRPERLWMLRGWDFCSSRKCKGVADAFNACRRACLCDALGKGRE